MSTNTSWRRFLGLLLPFTLLLGVFCLPATAGGTRHPYFNDRGTLAWYHSLAEAQAAARHEGKLVFIEYGRKRCSNCRKLAQNVLPHAHIRGRIADTAVGLAAECDQPERAVWQLFRRHLANARSLPFVAFITPDGQWVTGWAGYRSVHDVSAHLSVAESTVQALRAPSCGTSAARPARESTHVRYPAPPPQPRAAPPAQSRRAAPAPRPAPRPVPCERVVETPDPRDECADGACEGGNCRPPSFELPTLPNPFELLDPCKPCPPKPCPPRPCPPTCPTPVPAAEVERAAPRVASREGYGDFPPPAPPVPEPRRMLAGTEKPATATGSPDGAAPARKPVSMPPTAAAAAAAGALPAPVVRPRAPAMAPISKATEAPAELDPATRLKRARLAAAEQRWAVVIELTRDADAKQPELLALNRKAHGWAHGRLAGAVRAMHELRFAEAESAVKEVRSVMHGESLAVDAERGAQAIELMRDLDFLPKESAVRSTVRRTAYEKMRGTRWAPLFSECAPPNTALTSR